MITASAVGMTGLWHDRDLTATPGGDWRQCTSGRARALLSSSADPPREPLNGRRRARPRGCREGRCGRDALDGTVSTCLDGTVSTCCHDTMMTSRPWP